MGCSARRSRGAAATWRPAVLPCTAAAAAVAGEVQLFFSVCAHLSMEINGFSSVDEAHRNMPMQKDGAHRNMPQHMKCRASTELWSMHSRACTLSFMTTWQDQGSDITFVYVRSFFEDFMCAADGGRPVIITGEIVMSGAHASPAAAVPLPSGMLFCWRQMPFPPDARDMRAVADVCTASPCP